MIGIVLVLLLADVSELTRQLESEKTVERWEACKALRKLGPKAKAAVPALIKALADKRTCADAALALRYIAPKDGRVVKALVGALDTAPPTHRQEVVRALTAAKRRFHPALPWLVREVRTNKHGYAARAAEWIKELACLPHEGIGGLKAADPDVRARLLLTHARALGVALLQDESPVVRRAAAKALIDVEGATPWLIRTMADPDEDVRESVARTVRDSPWFLLVTEFGEGSYDLTRGTYTWGKPKKIELVVTGGNAEALLARERSPDFAAELEAVRAVASDLDKALYAAMADGSRAARACGAMLLGYVATDKARAMQRLRRAVAEDKSAWVKREAQRALERMR